MGRIKSRIIHKHATESEWNNSTLIPLNGEVVIYDEDNNYNYKRIKIGDGTHIVEDLPFIDDHKSQIQIVKWEADD